MLTSRRLKFTQDNKTLPMALTKSLTNSNAHTNLIIVMGVSGAGKSTLAQALAAHYDYHFVDADDYHNTSARELMARGTPLTDAQRTPWVAAIKQDLKRNEALKSHTLLAFSGLRQKHRNELRSVGMRTLFLFLDGDKHTIQTRLNNRKGHFMAPQLLETQIQCLENPLSEPDVYALEVSPSTEKVLNEAIAIVDKALFKKS
jgi:gluconokinase